MLPRSDKRPAIAHQGAQRKSPLLYTRAQLKQDSLHWSRFRLEVLGQAGGGRVGGGKALASAAVLKQRSADDGVMFSRAPPSVGECDEDW